MSSGYHVKTEELYQALETISARIETWQEQLAQAQQAVVSMQMSTAIQGAAGDSIRSYLSEVQVPVIEGIRQVLEEYALRLTEYVIGYQGIDTQTDAELSQSSLEDQHEKLLGNQGKFQDVVERVNAALADISDIVSVTQPDRSTADSAYSGLATHVYSLNQQVGEYEEAHKTDCQSVEEMMETLRSILASRTSPDMNASSYVPGSYILNPAYSKLRQQMETSEQYTEKGFANVPVSQEVSMEIEASQLDELLETLGILADHPAYKALHRAAVNEGNITLLVNGVTFVVDESGKVHLSGKIMDGVKDASGTIHKWDEQGIGKVLKKLGVDMGTGETFNKKTLKNWNRYGIEIDETFKIKYADETLDTLEALSQVSKSGGSAAGKIARISFADEMKIWKDILPETYKKSNTLGKVGHGFGAVGTFAAVGSNVGENMIDDYGNLNITSDTVQDTVSDTVVDITTGAGAMAAGAAIGTTICPVAGTVAGVVIGFAIDVAINWDVKDIDGDGEKDSLVDLTKDWVDEKLDDLLWD